MQIRWSAEAAEDLERIGLHIGSNNPSAARRVVRTIYEGVSALKTFPERGRVGRLAGSRELVFPVFPDIAVYRIIRTDRGSVPYLPWSPGLAVAERIRHHSLPAHVMHGCPRRPRLPRRLRCTVLPRLAIAPEHDRFQKVSP